MTSVRALVEANLPVPAGDLVVSAQVVTAAATASALTEVASGMAPRAGATALVAERRAVLAVPAIAPVGDPQAVLAAGPAAVRVSVEVPPVPSRPAANGALTGRSAADLAVEVSAFHAVRAALRAAVMLRADRSVVVPAPKAVRS